MSETEVLPITDDDADDDDWMSVQPARGMRLRVPTAVLLALAVLAGGFWIGAVVEKHDGISSTSTATAFTARLRAAGGTAAGAGFGTGAAGGGANATRGTVIDVAGRQVTISDSATGGIDKVAIGAATTVSRTGVGSPGSLQVGDTVVVRGSPGAGGVIEATSITATAPGVAASGFGGGTAAFGGGGGGTGGAAAG